MTVSEGVEIWTHLCTSGARESHITCSALGKIPLLLSQPVPVFVSRSVSKQRRTQSGHKPLLPPVGAGLWGSGGPGHCPAGEQAGGGRPWAPRRGSCQSPVKKNLAREELSGIPPSCYSSRGLSHLFILWEKSAAAVSFAYLILSEVTSFPICNNSIASAYNCFIEVMLTIAQ